MYPDSNVKINEILKNNEEYIGNFSKNNVPKQKNNQSTIVNLANSYDKGTHWIGMKFYSNKSFYFDSYGISFIPDVIKNNTQMIKLYQIFIESKVILVTNVESFV